MVSSSKGIKCVAPWKSAHAGQAHNKIRIQMLLGIRCFDTRPKEKFGLYENWRTVTIFCSAMQARLGFAAAGTVFHCSLTADDGLVLFRRFFCLPSIFLMSPAVGRASGIVPPNSSIVCLTFRPTAS